MALRAPTAALALLLTSLPLMGPALASTQDDAGLGADAPNTLVGAVTLPPGTYVGETRFGEGDKEDWYRFVPGPCEATFTFRATSDGLWGGVYRDDGTFIQNAFSGGAQHSFTVQSTSPVRFGLGDFFRSDGTATYTFTVTVAAPGADAGTACDAPDAIAAAMPLPLGTYTGETDFAAGDREDWYRFTPPPCEVLVFTVRGAGAGLYFNVHHDGGGLLHRGFSLDTDHTYVASDRFPVRLGLGDASRTTGTATYTFTVSSAPASTPAAREDAGVVCDAPNAPENAIPLPLGSYTGHLRGSRGDVEDWYLLTVAPCNDLRVTASTDAGAFHVSIYRASALAATHFVPADTRTIEAFGEGQYLLRFRYVSWSSEVAYAFTATRFMDDAGTGCDAAATTSEAVAIEPAPVERRAELHPGLGDERDVFKLDTAAECSLLTVHARSLRGALLFTLRTLDDQVLVAAPVVEGTTLPLALVTSTPVWLQVEPLEPIFPLQRYGLVFERTPVEGVASCNLPPSA